MPRRRRHWTRKTREEVLLRSFFNCTRPGCTQPAWELHHVHPHSKRGTDAAANVIGLCEACHDYLHHPSTVERDPDTGEFIDGVTMGRRWLADQVDECPVRVSPVLRAALFEEVVAVTRNPEAAQFHQSSVYDRNRWSSYEVFLKAAWVYLTGVGRADSIEGALVLERMVDLYRRRQSSHHQAAARRTLARLMELLRTLGARARWLQGRVGYHAAYIEFLADASGSETLSCFEAAAQLDAAQGNRVGAFITTAHALVVRARRRESPQKVQTELLRVCDALSRDNSANARRWAEENIPILLALTDLQLRRNHIALQRTTQLVERHAAEHVGRGPRPAKTLWYHGLALIGVGEIAAGTASIEEARTAYLASAIAEGRAAMLVSLGDAHAETGDMQLARARYEEALRQPAGLDNAAPIRVARRRLAALRTKNRRLSDPVFIP